MRVPILILLATTLMAQTSYDLLLKGGHVIDPKNKINAVRDVGIRDGHIAAVAANIPASQARKVVNLSGLYVTPGLIDIHAHVFAGSDGTGLAGGHSSIFPDAFALRTGVTTVVDAGSSGRHNFAEFKKTVIDRARTRVLALLNIGGAGMPGDDHEQNVGDMDAKGAAEVAIANRETIVGIKVAHYRGPDCLLAMNNARWIPRRPVDHILERHPHIQEFRHHIQLILHARVDAARVNVGGNGVGQKALLNGRDRLAELERGAAVTDVKQNAALARLKQIGHQAALGIQHGYRRVESTT
jgi:hypothetical protein